VTSTSFLLKSGDVGKVFFARITAKRPGYQDGVFDTASVTVFA